MGSTDTLCLRWNDFESNIKQGFSILRDDEDFFDVTLACGSNQIKAHKVILSACSSFFRSLLKSIPHQHPFLYLRGIDFHHLESVLSFMYNGEVRVDQGDLNQFLGVAQELKVNGLIQDQENHTKNKFNVTKMDLEAKDNSSTSSKIKSLSNLFPAKENDEDPSDNDGDHLGESSSLMDVPFISIEPSDPGDDVTDEFDEEFEGNGSNYFDKSDSEQNPIIDSGNSKRTNELLDAELLKYVSDRDANNLFRCLKCPHTSRFKRDVKRHVEAKHLSTCFRCSKCFRIFKTRRSLSKHEMRMHRRGGHLLFTS